MQIRIEHFGIIMIKTIIYLVFWLSVTTHQVTAQLARCSYGERGSLTATCENASIKFFRSTTYHFDILDETLRCVNCNLDTVEANSFDISGNQIQILDLRNSKIRQLKNSSFTGLVFLKTLNLQNNSIDELSTGMFKGIKKITTLNMAHNQIKTVGAYSFKELFNLTTLNLEYNQIESLDGNALSGLHDLSTLMVHHNNLSHVGNFSNLIRLVTLDLSFNKIDTVKMGDMNNMTSLLHLNLAHNKLTAVDKGNFHTLKQMLTLDLSWNNIKTLAVGGFENLKRLEILTLSYNNIKDIQKGTFYDLVNLRELEMNNNELVVFKTGLFTGMPEMAYLNVSYNRLKLFIGTGSMTLASLHTLDLAHNNLTDLYYKVILNHMPHISYLGLENNPWPCYLVAELDEYVKDDNVKLSVDGILRNTSCLHMRSDDVEAMASSQLEEEEIIYAGYAHAHVVYPLMSVMFLIICGLVFVLYRLTRYNSFLGQSIRTTSHVNLMSNDVLANE